MRKKKLRALHPSYYTKFACTGSDCEDHCCKYWNIDIDKKTYTLYRNIRDPEFSQSFSGKVKRIRDKNASDARYARFVLNEQGECPFLQDDKLCGIQKKYGHEYLCFTCQVYPRMMGIVQDNLREISLTTSCPQAARIALFPEERMTFEISEFELDERDVLLKYGANRIDPECAGGKLVPHAWVIREGCIDILQCRNLALTDRFLAVGMLLNKLTEMEKEGDADNAPDTVASYVRLANGGEFDRMLEKLADNPELRAVMQSVLMTYAMDMCVKRGEKYAPFRGFAVVVGKWMGENDLEEAKLGETYKLVETHVDRYWDEFLGNYGHVLENYFVNLIFTRRFPFFYKGLNPYQHFIALVEQYALIRMLICVNAEARGGVTEELLMQVINAMSMDVMHAQNAERIVETYRETGNDTLAHISFLLR